MRVISGSARGLRLETLPGQDITRPTIDRVKEAVFGAIQFDLAGARVLDAFAGSGALGIEALSRGAREAVFIDIDARAVACVKRNLKAARLEERACVLRADFLTGMAQAGGQFDFIFLDPPYQSGLYQSAVDAALERGLLAEKGQLIAEHDGTLELDGLELTKCRKYGKVYVSFYRRRQENG